MRHVGLSDNKSATVAHILDPDRLDFCVVWDAHCIPAPHLFLCLQQARAFRAGEEGVRAQEWGEGGGVRRGLVEGSWIILQPADPPHPLQSRGQ